MYIYIIYIYINNIYICIYNLLNKRTKILGTCRHRNKYELKNCDSTD